MRELKTIQRYTEFNHKEGSKYKLEDYDDDGIHMNYSELDKDGFSHNHKVLREDKKNGMHYVSYIHVLNFRNNPFHLNIANPQNRLLTKFYQMQKYVKRSTKPASCQTAVRSSFYEIKIHKSDSEIINEYLFSPKIVKFVDSTSICCYLNFPYNWANWQLPKRLHKKDLKIISFDKTKIVVGW